MHENYFVTLAQAMVILPFSKCRGKVSGELNHQLREEMETFNIEFTKKNITPVDEFIFQSYFLNFVCDKPPIFAEIISRYSVVHTCTGFKQLILHWTV